jgi:hypothetical protein
MSRTIITVVAFVLALHVSSAVANGKHPLDYSLREYAFLLSLALLGGFVAFYSKVRAGTVQAWNITHLIGELTTSAFAGLLAFWICEEFRVSPLLTASLVGISGHMGARAITAFEQLAARRWGSGS